MKNKPIFTSKLPIGFFVGLIVSIVFFIVCIFKIHFPDAIVYPSIVFILWFLTISKYSCRLIIYPDKIYLRYLAFWHLDKEVILTDIESLTVKVNYWSFNTRYDQHIFKHYIFYDTISLTDKNNHTELLRINIRIGQLNKAVAIIDNTLRMIKLNNR